MHDVTRGIDERIVSSKTMTILCTSSNKQSGGFDETNFRDQPDRSSENPG